MQVKKNKPTSLWMIDIVGSLICVVVTVVAYGLAVKPLMAQRQLVKNASRQLQIKRAEAGEINTSLRELKKLTIAARDQLANNGLELEAVDTINQQIAELTNLLTECRLATDDIHTGRIQIGRRCDLVPIRISGKGRYDRFVLFLHKLNLNLPDISVVGLSLQGTPDRPGEKGSFEFELFWYAAPSLS